MLHETASESGVGGWHMAGKKAEKEHRYWNTYEEIDNILYIPQMCIST